MLKLKPILKVLELKPPKFCTDSFSRVLKSIYHVDHHTKEEYLIIVLGGMNNTKLTIIKFNIKHNQYNQIATIKDDILQYSIDCFFDKDENKLHFFRIDDSHKMHDILCVDLQSKTQEYSGIYPCPAEKCQISSCYVNGKNHVFRGREHMIWDSSKHKKLWKIDDTDFAQVNHRGNDAPLIAYLSEINEIVMIRCCDYSKASVWSLKINKESVGKWMKCMDSEIDGSKHYGFVHGFGHIMYIIDGRQIWCLDMIDKKWYKSDKIFSRLITSRYGCFAASGGRYCYYLTENSRCFKIDLFEAAPIELQNKIKQRYEIKNNKICIGYCRENEKDLQLNIPDYLKRIILRYFHDIPQ